MPAASYPRASLVGGIIMIAVGIARILIGVYVALGVILIVLGVVAMLVPFWQRRRGS